MYEAFLEQLFEHGLKEPRCEKCDNFSWMGQPIPLILWYLDDNHRNEDLTNMKVYCPNCFDLFGHE